MSASTNVTVTNVSWTNVSTADVMPTQPPIELREPLALVSGTLWIHAVFSTVACTLLLSGVAVARRRAAHPGYRWSSHRLLQVTGVLMALFGIVMALSNDMIATPNTHAPHPTGERKRHLPPLREGAAHAHSAWHTLGGLALFFGLVVQAILGCVRASEVRGAAAPASAELHRRLGYALTLVVLPLQMASGAVALLQLCSDELSGFDQCVGHNGTALALLAAATGYWSMPSLSNYEEAKRRYDVFALENGVAGAVGLSIVLYSLYSEYPYATNSNGAHHVAAGGVLLALGGAGLALVFWARSRTLPLPRMMVSGTAVTLVSAIGGALMLAHRQPSEYGVALHQLFGVLLFFVALARSLRWRRVLAFLLVEAALVFAASQRGLQRLHAHFYSDALPIGAVVFLLLLTGALLFFATTLCLRWSAPRTPFADDDFSGADIEDVHHLDAATDSELSRRVASLVKE